MTKEDIDIKSKLDSITWSVFRLNRDTPFKADISLTKSQLSVTLHSLCESRSPVFASLTYYSSPRLFDDLDHCERFLLRALRREWR